MTAVMPAGWAELEDMASYLTSAAKDDLPRKQLLFARDMLDLLDSGRLPNATAADRHRSSRIKSP